MSVQAGGALSLDQQLWGSSSGAVIIIVDSYSTSPVDVYSTAPADFHQLLAASGEHARRTRLGASRACACPRSLTTEYPAHPGRGQVFQSTKNFQIRWMNFASECARTSKRLGEVQIRNVLIISGQYTNIRQYSSISRKSKIP